MTAQFLRFPGRIRCDLGLHDYRLTEKKRRVHRRHRGHQIAVPTLRAYNDQTRLT